jgi:hypothetical protein
MAARAEGGMHFDPIKKAGNKLSDGYASFKQEWEQRPESAKLLLAAEVFLALILIKYLSTTAGFAAQGDFKDAKGYALDSLALAATAGVAIAVDKIRGKKSREKTISSSAILKSNPQSTKH